MFTYLFVYLKLISMECLFMVGEKLKIIHEAGVTAQ